MKATYYKDTMHSYMIIPCPPEAETTGYQYRMLEMNRIDGILQCGLRHIDGTGLLYYDTTGKQSLSGLYGGRKIPGAELFRILETMDRVSGSLSKYLLDEQHLVLNEEQIFYDFSSGTYYFTYYPGEIVDPKVFRFLADSIDGKDKKAAAAAYRLCSVSGDDRQALREAIREEAVMKDAVPEWETAADKLRIERTAQDAESETAGMEPQLRDDTDRRFRKYKPDYRAESLKDEVPERGKAARNTPGRKTESGKISIAVRILLITALIAGAAGLFAVQLLVYISQRERRLCIAGSILLTICACLIIAEMIIRVRKRHKVQREEESRREPLYSESDEADLPVFGSGTDADLRLSSDETGNTVRFSEQDMTGRLYGRDRGNRIDLRTLPLTVGKAPAYSDVVLADPSVSRVHARIYKGEDGCIEIRDLDSTNGTYINGEKMEPNEKRRVQRGDEVRFGNVEYEYR